MNCIFSQHRIKKNGRFRWILVLGPLLVFLVFFIATYPLVTSGSLEHVLSHLIYETDLPGGLGFEGIIRKDEQIPVILEKPSLDSLVPEHYQIDKTIVRKNHRKARSYHYNGYIYRRPSNSARVVGIVRPGKHINAASRTRGKGCKRGRWYRAMPFGYVCTRKGFIIENVPSPDEKSWPYPDTSKPLPYQYAEVITPQAPRFKRIPSLQQQQWIQKAPEENGDLPDYVADLMEGIFFIAIDKLIESEGRQYYRTVRARYVRADDVKVYSLYPMRGEVLGEIWKLPLAFVYGEDRYVFKLRDGKLQKIGIAQKHSRFMVEKVLEIQKEIYVQGPGEILLKRDHLRVVDKIIRPKKIPLKSKWIHVNLKEQTLVAYENDKPVFTTLVSSGKEGYLTPRGIFRIRHKHITVTMNGDDPIDGYYEVEEVPWTMYYWKAFALHGAYWHNDFGEIRSHGCTNIPPSDAQWLFNWTRPRVPRNWQAIRHVQGTWVYFTR